MTYRILLLLALVSVRATAQDKPLPVPRFITQALDTADYWPAFNADGQSVIFCRNLPGIGYKFYQVGIAGGEAKPFTGPFAGQQTRPSLGPGSLIAFTGIVAKQPSYICIVNSQGTQIRTITTSNLTGDPLYPSWLNGKDTVVVVAYQGKEGGILEKVPLNGGNALPLTNFDSVRCGMPDVAPHGRALVFAGQRANISNPYNQNLNAIWIMDLPNGTPRKLTTTRGRAPKWSHNGKWIAYESTAGSPNGTYAIFIIRPDGTGNRRITDYQWNANHPVWSADDRSMVISADNATLDKKTHIAIIDLAGIIKE
jgi:Tol biopolymer transport system component